MLIRHRKNYKAVSSSNAIDLKEKPVKRVKLILLEIEYWSCSTPGAKG